jgi:hypothetical protein
MANTFALWFRQKYNLPPSDPRFLALTPEDIEAEYWAAHYQSNKVTEEFEDNEFDQDAEIRRIEEAAEARERAAAEAAANAPKPEPLPDPATVKDWEEVPDL